MHIILTRSQYSKIRHLLTKRQCDRVRLLK